MRIYFSYYLLFFIFLNVSAQIHQSEEVNIYALIEHKMYDSALLVTEQLLKDDPKEVDLLTLKGKILYDQKQYTQALETWRKVNSMRNNYVSFEIALCYSKIGDSHSSVRFLEAHLKSQWKKPLAEIKLHPDLESVKNSTEWNELWLKDWNNKSENIIAEATYLLKYGNNIDALNLLNESLNEKSSKHEFYALRGDANAALLNYSQAVKDYTSAIEKRSEATYYLKRARAYSNMKKYDKSIADLVKYLDDVPQSFKVYLERAQNYAYNGEYQKAIEDVNFYLNYFPEDTEVMYKLGRLYYDNEDYLSALKYINKCISDSPNEPEYLKFRGSTYLKTRMFNYAYKDITMVLDLDPNDAEAWLIKGTSRQKMNDLKGACRDWEKASGMGNKEAKSLWIDHCQF